MRLPNVRAAIMVDDTTNTSEPPIYMSMSMASIGEIILPPMAVLGCAYVAFIILWLNTHGSCFSRVLMSGRLLSRASVSAADSLYTEADDKNSANQRLLSVGDHNIVHSIRNNTNRAKNLLLVLLPATLSLAFCPLTLFTHKLILDGFWPPSKFPKAPNINDGIACFLVPAGMVYAISFGFAFQAVFTRHQEVDRCINDEINRLNRVISLVCRIQFPLQTRLSILRTIKDDVMALIQDILGTRKQSHYDSRKEAFQDIVLSLTSTAPAPTCESVLRKELVKLVSTQVYRFDLKCPHNQRLHPVMWGFLETLGYFNFMAMLLVQTQSYMMDLSMCIITVISISMLCFVIADLDSPFNGFFRANLDVLPSLVARLDAIFNNFMHKTDDSAVKSC